MIEFSKSRIDVKQWPDDLDACHALSSFFDEIDPGVPFIPILSGGGLDFSGADLSGMELAGAELSSARLQGVVLRRAGLYRAWIRQADLAGADLSGADLRKALITHCTAQNLKLAGARLSDTDFSGTDLRGADIRGTSLDDAFLHGSDLRGADLRDSSWGTIPRNAVLALAKLGGADVTSMTGEVSDPIDVGIVEPSVLQGVELQEWFVDNGAPEVRIVNSPLLRSMNGDSNL